MRRITLSLLVVALAAGLSTCALTRTSGTSRPDLSSPDATVINFTKAAARGDVETAQACFLPGGIDYNDIREVLAATPSSPRYSGRVMLEAVDPDAPMPIISIEETSRGLLVVWRVTFRRAVEIRGQTVMDAGATYDFDAMLKKSGDQWLIDGF